ncbi:Fe-S cluster assembly protein HesB [Bacillaceae bacterium SIJ1]|uniref:3-hexulose-6-phosphate synthase n=1 Tax=Litoribacterium kuwaitense TaxID=1398745 RepID=UPI0013EBBB31|nr:3-hexulose-6-phosphate synthase [Litoribacterium kuwaitense]NGP44833.1 Fe-S cluster assembly protein HesB [Litoribacterium kuwaitense]
MKLQLALDRLSEKEAFAMAQQVKHEVDWFEVGTGVIKQYGMSFVTKMKETFPEHTIVADMKTCDAGKHEALQAFDAGADVTTVMAFSHLKTMTEMLEVAERTNQRVMVDLLGVTDRTLVEKIYEAGARFFSLHAGKDMQQEGQTAAVSQHRLVADLPDATFTVAGGINLQTVPAFLPIQPEAIIVGSAITKAADPQEAARAIREVINQ